MIVTMLAMSDCNKNNVCNKISIKLLIILIQSPTIYQCDNMGIVNKSIIQNVMSMQIC